MQEWLGVEDALSLVRDDSQDTVAPDNVEKIVWQRISGYVYCNCSSTTLIPYLPVLRYPLALRTHVHITKAHLPTDIARALSVDPSLIQKPVETFYTRDALQLRASDTSFPLNYIFITG
jgi:hypothetical protein